VFGSMGLLLAFFSGSMVMLGVDKLLRTSGPASLSLVDISTAVLLQKVKMHEDEGDRLRADIATYEVRVAELEKHLAQSMASTEASLAIAATSVHDSGCEEESESVLTLEGVVKKPWTKSSSSSSSSSSSLTLGGKEDTGGGRGRGKKDIAEEEPQKQKVNEDGEENEGHDTATAATAAAEEGGDHNERGTPPPLLPLLAPLKPLPRGAKLFERAHDGSVVTAMVGEEGGDAGGGGSSGGVGGGGGGPEEANEEKRARVREAVENHRRTTVVDKGKREYDSTGAFVGYNEKKKVQLPRNYFIDYNETSDTTDVRPDGTYKGYGTPKRKAWLNKHTKRILHDFQWVYENNRVHQRQRFLGVRIGQDPFDALVIQEMLFDVKPDLIIETGTNSGGGALFMAVMMEAINPDCKIFTIDTVPISAWVKRFKNSATGGVSTTATKGMPGSDHDDNQMEDAKRRNGSAGESSSSSGGGRSGGGSGGAGGGGRRLLSVVGGSEDGEKDEEEELSGLVDPRENVFWKKRVTQAVGKSTDRRILRQLKHDFVAKAKKVLVVLDSDHSSGTVLSELINYAPFVSLGSYILVEDTWQRHPLFAAEKFLENYGDEFIQDRSREHLMWSQHKGGWLKRVKLPARTKAGGLDYDYKVDVEVSGGRVKTYGMVDIDAPE